MNDLSTTIDLKSFLPDCYKDIIEAEAEQDALSIEINHLNSVFIQAMMDQFIQHCSLKAIGYYEEIFHILADPENETLQQRRDRVLYRMRNLRPPYTQWYLRKMLDKFFGVGKYSLDIDNDNFTITIESSSDDSFWYHEIQVTMTAIKPCNMVYINKPNVYTQLRVGETIYSADTTRNYKLNGTWYLGLRPFITLGNEGVQKMPTVHSVQDDFIDLNLTNWQSTFAKVVLNESETITALTKSKQTDSITVEYLVTSAMVSTITKIQILDSNDTVLIESNVFIPVDDSVTLKHIIRLKEEGV